MQKDNKKRHNRHFLVILALTVLGAGRSPFMPGTCGSLVVAAIYLTLALITRNSLLLMVVMGLLIIQSAIVTVLFSPVLIKIHGPDPSCIVSDEQCGQAISYLWLWPLASWNNSSIIIFAIAGFVLFRFFDILKPPPVRQLEYLKDGWGILLDDVMAGVYAWVILQLLVYWRVIPWGG